MMELFTVDQIELIRRLRNSGISKEQVVKAFETMDRLDMELGPTYQIPVSLAQHLTLRTPTSLPTPAHQPHPPPTSISNGHTTPSMALQLHQHSQQQQASLMLRPPTAITTSNSTMGTPPQVAQKRPCENNAATAEEEIFVNGAAAENFINGMDELEDSEEMAELIVKGEPVIHEEIKQFIISHNIKQYQIAAVSGLSQSYVSRYMRGEFEDFSDRSRKAIYKFYLAFRKYPAAIGTFSSLISLPGSPAMKRMMVSKPPESDFSYPSDFIYPKRERFTFRPSHLEVLEQFFTDDAYPSWEKREEIAKACNEVITSPGQILSDREKVTCQIVSNWFANKRKEMKKLAREEGIEFGFRGRGRPGLTSEYAHPSNAFLMRRNSSDQDSNQSAESSNTHPTNPPSNNKPPPPPVLTAPTTASSIASKTSTINSVVRERSRAHPDFPGDDQALSLAVEMAAVNQAIVALSEQRDGIKEESIDDDDESYG